MDIHRVQGVSSKNTIREFNERQSGRPGVPQFFRTSEEYDAKIEALVRAMPGGKRTKRALFEALLDGQALQLSIKPEIVDALSKAIQRLRTRGLAEEAERLVALLRVVSSS